MRSALDCVLIIINMQYDDNVHDVTDLIYQGEEPHTKFEFIFHVGDF